MLYYWSDKYENQYSNDSKGWSIRIPKLLPIYSDLNRCIIKLEKNLTLKNEKMK